MMEKKIQLFLLPFAGGSSLSFMRVIRFLNPCIHAITVEYAGRGKRKEEKFIQEYDAFLDDVVSYILTRRNIKVPYAILGYSLGSALAFDLVRKNRLNDKARHCFFCAEGSLLAKNPAREYGLLNDTDFMDKIISLGGMDDRLLNNQQALDTYLNIIKNDHNILAQFVYESGIVEQDASIIYSPKDQTCIQMKDWSRLVGANIDYYEIGDNHLFINQHYREMAKIINDKLKLYTE